MIVHKAYAYLVLCTLSFSFGQSVESTANAKARNDTRDRHWAITTRLSLETIHQLRIIAGVSEDAIIANLDRKNLSGRNHVLLVEVASGKGYCLRLHVLQVLSESATQVWALSELPDNSEGICRQGPVNPSAHATPDGRIIVDVPVYSEPFQRTLPIRTYTYAWDGGRYHLVNNGELDSDVR